MARKSYSVWQIGRTGEYHRLIKHYKTERGAKNRAEKEADEAIRSGQKFIVTSGTGRVTDFEDVRASRVGMDGIEYSGGALYEFEVQ